MPLIDLNGQKAAYQPPETDVTVIGAGTAGIMLAVSLVQKGQSVLLIESGDLMVNDEKQKLNAVEQTGKILRNAEWGRKRVVGGTTVAWGGQSLPFIPIDFEEREWVANSGWPLAFEDIAPWYKAADRFMDIDDMNHNTDIFPKIRFKDPGLDRRIFDIHVSKWTNNTNFYIAHKNIIEEKITVLYNAQLTGINQYSGTVSSIDVSNFRGETYVFRANKLVLATGTIEAIRILLNNGIGDHSGLLGKYFMDHPCIEIGTIHSKNIYRLQRMFNTHVYNGRKYSLRLSLSPAYQRENQLLNCSASIMFRTPKGAFDVYAGIKQFIKDRDLKKLLKISRSLPSLLKSGFAYVKDRFYFKPGTIPKLSLMLEQEPVEDSFITIGETVDRFGIPLPSINWAITDRSWETIVVTAFALKEQLEKSGAGNVEIYNYIHAGLPQWREYVSDVCHNMGGCRMSSDPSGGVVDTNLRVWHTNNLYVCSQAVFPTGSHSNPVLTMLALTLRLSHHLTEVAVRGRRLAYNV